jgi:AcrR family transcriptional regulator
MTESMISSSGATSLPKRARGRPKKIDDRLRRTEIIDCARKTFVEFGFAGTTTDLVASRCKISKQTLYSFFAHKSDLFLAVVIAHRELVLALPRPVGEDLPLEQAIARIFRLDIDEDSERERDAFINLLVRESEQYPEISELLYTKGALPARQLLADWLAAQKTLGRLDIADTLNGARMLMDMIFGAIGRPHHRSLDWPDRNALRLYQRLCIAVFIRGHSATAAT